MTGASKILTVSYGTFSCTLEGFDDPFNTMKAIAEYFRDLAADDRYFGAEPPQPDAAMLHKIAEREIQRRVEAKIQDNGVILRAGADQTQAIGMAAAAPVAAPVQPVAETVEAPLPRVTMPAEPLIAPAQTPSVAATAEATGETVAERLSRLRRAAAEAEAEAIALAAVAKLKPAPAATVAPVVQAMVAEPTAPEDLQAAPDLAMDAEPMAAIEPEAEFSALTESLPEVGEEETIAQEPEVPSVTVDETAAVDDEKLLSLIARDSLSEEDHAVSQPQPVAQDDTDDDDFLAMLSETLASGSEAITEVAPQAMPETANSPAEEAEDDLGDMIAPAHVAEMVDTSAKEAPTEPELADQAEQFDDEDDWLLATPTAVAAPAEPPVAVDAAEENAQAILERAEPSKDAQPEALVSVRPSRPVRRLRVASETNEEPAPEPVAATPAPVAEPEADPQVAETANARPKARVIRVRRLSSAGDVPAPAAAEVAQTPAPVATPVRPASPVRVVREQKTVQRLGPAGDDSVNRLMAEATQQMSGADNRRRQNAIAHLKAAVAATMAERRATGQDLSPNRDAAATAYREDLAKAFTPEDRPAAQAETAHRSAPLVLASAQRVDRPNAVQVASDDDDDEPIGLAAALADPIPSPVRPAPTRPSLVRSAPSARALADIDEDSDEEDAGENMFGSELSFAEFVEKIGAQDMPKLLEAAAAYVACIEGNDSFTRPQLIRHVNGVTTGAAREDSLRSFGALLREGRIERSARGRYALPEGAEILQEARRIAS